MARLKGRVGRLTLDLARAEMNNRHCFPAATEFGLQPAPAFFVKVLDLPSFPFLLINL